MKNGYTMLFWQTLFRQTLFRQSTVGTSGSWLQLNGQYRLERRRTKSRKSGGYLSPIMGLAFQNVGTKVWKARPNMHGAQIASVPRSMPYFRCIKHLDPLQCFSNFYCFYICLSVLKMYWVVLTADCRNSVCRNSVCLPWRTFGVHFFGIPCIVYRPKRGRRGI